MNNLRKNKYVKISYIIAGIYSTFFNHRNSNNNLSATTKNFCWIRISCFEKFPDNRLYSLN